MKKIILVALLCFWMVCDVTAGGVNPYIAGSISGGGGAPACATTAYECAGSESGSMGIARYGSQSYWSSPFTGDGSTICGVRIPLIYAGSPDYTINVIVYSDSTGAPSTAFSTASDGIEANTLTQTTQAGAVANPEEVAFGTPFTPLNGVPYHIVVYSPDGDQPNDDYASWVRSNICTEEGLYYDDDGTAPFTSDLTGSSGIYEFLKE